MDTIEVKILEPYEFSSWDELVELSPTGTIFHKSQWLLAAGRESNVRKTEIYGAFSNDVLIGGCAVHSYLFAGLFVWATTTLPLTPYGGVITHVFENTKIRKKEKYEWSIIYSLISYLQKRYPNLLTLTMSPQVIDIRPYTWQGWTESVKYCYISPLSGNIAQIISKNVNRSVNKAKKIGIEAKQIWDYNNYWDLTLKTYNKQGIKPPFSQKLLFSLLDRIRENQWGEMWVAETTSGEIVASEIIIWDHQMAYRWSAVSHDQYKNTGATSFLLVQIMTRLQERGFNKINMMAANTPQLAKFVSSFNPELTPYYCVKKSRSLFRIFNAIQSIFK